MNPRLDSTDRREFMKAVVALGTSSALAACIDRGGEADIPTGVEDRSDLPDRQHGWNAVLTPDDAGNPMIPRHHVLRFLTLSEDGIPSESARETVDEALHTIERAYEWSSSGVLFTIGYGPSYFDRFDVEGSTIIPEPEPLADFEDPELDGYDAVLHLASDEPQAVVAAENGVLGDADTMNEVSVSSRLSDVFDAPRAYPARRTGFIGDGLPKEEAADVSNVPAEKIPEDAPLFMGFKSAFKENQASEDRITIDDGPFAGGTTQHISALELNLNQWWNQDSRWQRVAKMFSPTHAQEELVEGVGANLGTDSEMDQVRDPDEDADSMGVVGHSQKMVSAREDDEPVILRRDFDTTDEGSAGLHFLAVQESIEDFVKTREAMNGADIAANSPVGQRNNNGILQYLRTRRRGNYLLPPRSQYALPDPT